VVDQETTELLALLRDRLGKFSRVEQERDDLRGQLGDLQGSLAQAEARNRELLDELETRPDQSAIDDLRTENKRLNERLEALGQENGTLLAQRDAARDVNAVQQSRIVEQEGDLDRLRAENEAARDSLAAATAALSAPDANRFAALETVMGQNQGLLGENQRLLETLEGLRGRNDDLHQFLEGLRGENAELHARFTRQAEETQAEFDAALAEERDRNAALQAELTSRAANPNPAATPTTADRGFDLGGSSPSAPAHEPRVEYVEESFNARLERVYSILGSLVEGSGDQPYAYIYNINDEGTLVEFFDDSSAKMIVMELEGKVFGVMRDRADGLHLMMQDTAGKWERCARNRDGIQLLDTIESAALRKLEHMSQSVGALQGQNSDLRDENKRLRRELEELRRQMGAKAQGSAALGRSGYGRAGRGEDPNPYRPATTIPKPGDEVSGIAVEGMVGTAAPKPGRAPGASAPKRPAADLHGAHSSGTPTGDEPAPKRRAAGDKGSKPTTATPVSTKEDLKPRDTTFDDALTRAAQIVFANEGEVYGNPKDVLSSRKTAITTAFASGWKKIQDGIREGFFREGHSEDFIARHFKIDEGNERNPFAFFVREGRLNAENINAVIAVSKEGTKEAKECEELIALIVKHQSDIGGGKMKADTRDSRETKQDFERIREISSGLREWVIKYNATILSHSELNAIATFGLALGGKEGELEGLMDTVSLKDCLVHNDLERHRKGIEGDPNNVHKVVKYIFTTAMQGVESAGKERVLEYAADYRDEIRREKAASRPVPRNAVIDPSGAPLSPSLTRRATTPSS